MGQTSYYANQTYYIKATILLLSTFLIEYFYVTRGGLFFSVLLGLLFAELGLNVQHDANHGALGPHKWFHHLFKHSVDLFGGSKISWQQQHVVSHHPYTNRIGKDVDITSGEPMLVFHPDSKNVKWYHKFQHFYYEILLVLYGPNSVSHLLNFRMIWKMENNNSVKSN